MNNQPKIEQGKWIKAVTREISLCMNSLIVESYKKSFSKLGLSGFNKYFVNGTYLCSTGIIISPFRYKPYYKLLDKFLQEKLKQKPKLLNEFYKTVTIKKIEIDKDLKKVDSLLRQGKLTKDDWEQVYFDLRDVFINFFTFQVLPFAIEQILNNAENQKAILKHKDVLVKWRGKTHKTQILLEDLFEVFFGKTKKVFKTDFRFWTDFEILNYFQKNKKIKVDEVKKRSIKYLMTWEVGLTPPYKVFSDQTSLKKCGLLSKITDKTITGNEFKGVAVYKGNVEGKAYIVKQKKYFKKLPTNSIVVCKVVEMDDFRIIKNKKVKAVITEEGGITTHIAIKGRELKVPVIVGVKGIVMALKQGTLIKVDANNGVIKIIKQ